MHWISDHTGWFPARPYYPPEELERGCEDLITAVLTSRRGRVAFPIATIDLLVLVDYLGAALEWSADLSADGRVIHACTEFRPGRRPLVRIARRLSAHPRDEHRLRTTLTHACGHVWLHRSVVEGGRGVTYRCEPTTMLRAPRSDWSEVQAGYVSGALLMPVSALRAVIEHVLKREQVLRGPFHVDSQAGQRLVQAVMAAFAVSAEAARVRLLQRGVLTEARVVQGELFA